eukprot:jgi/Hompol1/3186/HPOL_003139-RA
MITQAVSTAAVPTPIDVEASGQASTMVESMLPDDAILSDFAAGQIMFFQFPKILPEIVNQAQNSTDAASATAAAAQDPRNKGKAKVKDERSQTQRDALPSIMYEGQAGKLRIHRSGRITIQFGDVKFEVTRSPVVNFSQNLAYLDTETGTNTNALHFLGEVQNRFVCTPDIDALLRD